MSNEGLISDALRLTQPVLSLSMDVDDAFKGWIKSSGAKVALYRDYERGSHRAVITTQMRKMLRLTADDSGLVDFNDNYMQIVVDKMAGRLHVNEVTLSDTDQDKAWLSPLLEFNNWDALQGTVFRGAIRDGDSYLMVDPETLEWTSEAAYDGFSGVFALFDNNMNTPYWACKLWSEASSEGQDEVMRLVVYEPDKVSYWRGESDGSELKADNVVETSTIKEPFILKEGEELPEFINVRPWPLPSQTIPIIHFVNKYDNYSDSGESEIRPGIPLQDVLNRTLHSMVMASEFAAFNILWSKGIALDVTAIQPGAVLNLLLKDSNGNVITDLTPEATAFLQAVAVGQFTGTDIGQYTNQIDKIVREISQVTQTPIYGITNQGAVSGEALKQLEIGLIGKCERFQRQNTDAIRDLIKLSAEIQKTFNTTYEGTPPEIKTVAVAWKSPEILDVSQQLTVISQIRRDNPGLFTDDFYRARIGGLLGMNQTDISKEGVAAKNEASLNLLALTGGDGSIPPV